MTKDIKEKLRTCDPCQRYAKSHKQDPVEVSHTNMFNIFPGHTLHLEGLHSDGRSSDRVHCM